VVGHILWVDPHRFSLESDEILWSVVGLETVATDQVLFLANAFPELGEIQVDNAIKSFTHVARSNAL